jgi:hypothetical protein
VRAGDAVLLDEMGAELVVEAIVIPFAEEIEIVIAQEGIHGVSDG